MKNLNNLLRVKPRDRRLLVSSLLLLCAARIALSLLPFRVVQRLLARLRQSEAIGSKQGSPGRDKIVWAVAVASQYVPTTCLTQAIAAWIILVKHGEEAELRIGVAKNQAGKLEAHAWIESGGSVLIGDSAELLRYTPLPSLEERLP